MFHLIFQIFSRFWKTNGIYLRIFSKLYYMFHETLYFSSLFLYNIIFNLRYCKKTAFPRQNFAGKRKIEDIFKFKFRVFSIWKFWFNIKQNIFVYRILRSARINFYFFFILILPSSSLLFLLRDIILHLEAQITLRKTGFILVYFALYLFTLSLPFSLSLFLYLSISFSFGVMHFSSRLPFLSPFALNV